MSDELLAEQVRYYRARAPEYDDWWFRRGRYDEGPEANERRLAEGREVEAALERFRPAGRVLELACGTGLWTRHLVRFATSVTAVDASAETIELNRARVGEGCVEYVHADLFEWQPEARYDVCCFGFWLSHVPDARFAEFWDKVGRALEPDGRVFLVDSAAGDPAHTRREDEETEIRRLADGREFRIVKRRFEPASLERRLAELGWRFALARTSGGCFVYGGGERLRP